jgi:hypothetical protein
MMTASRRASATIAFFIPRCLAIFIAQALSQDHFAERSSMTLNRGDVAHADQLSADRKRNQKPPSDRIEQMRNFRSKLNLTCFLPSHHRSYQ